MTRIASWRAGVFLIAALTACAFGARAGEYDPDTARRLAIIDGVIDVIKSPIPDRDELARAGRGEVMNQAFVALTGEAINPLFGVTLLGVYNYIRADEAERDYLPIYDQPVVWAPLLVIIALMLFNSTLCEAMPWLKVPLNALGDLVNKAGAAAVLPLVVKMFADAAARPLGELFVMATDSMFPVAYAAEAASGGGVWHTLGWLAAAAIGAAVYLAVWMTFNVVDVLIMICPFPGLDALLKTFRLGVMGLLMGSWQLSETMSLLIALAVAAASFLVAGWSFRLSVFGLVYSTDILLFRRERATVGMFGFSSTGMKRRLNLPMRTLGRLEQDADGELAFTYRPWLVLARRRVRLGGSGDFCAGRGLLNPFVVEGCDKDVPWIRFAPRYRGVEEGMADAFALAGVVDCGWSGSLRSWLGGLFRGGAATA